MKSATRTISGTWGEVWLDSDYVGEAYGLQAKSTFNKEEVQICGKMAVDTKITSIRNSGTVKMYKVNSRMARKIGQAAKDGNDLRFTIISKLADPDSYGSERIALKNVSFDDITLADWEAATVGKVDVPFTFTDYDLLDEIAE